MLSDGVYLFVVYDDDMCCRQAPPEETVKKSTYCGFRRYLLILMATTLGGTVFFVWANRDQWEWEYVLHPEEWSFWDKESRDATVADATAASVLATKLWARLLISLAAFSFRQFLDSSKEHPALPWILCGCFFVFMSTYFLRREFRRRHIYERTNEKIESIKVSYYKCIKTVETKSRTAAKLLPHFLYFSFCGLLAYFCPGFVFDKLVDPVLFFFVGTVLPLGRGFYILQKMEDSTRKDSLVNGWLAYWTVFNSLVLLRALPFATLVFFETQWGKYGLLSLILWISSPMTNGASIALKGLLGFVNRNIKAIPKPKKLENANVVFRLLVASGILSDEKRLMLESIIMDSGSVVLIGSLFILTPGFLTKIGCLLVGYVYPIYASMISLKGKEKKTAYWWLLYFLVLVSLSTTLNTVEPVLGWLPLWYHSRLVLFIWLQLPYFRGAKVLYQLYLNMFAQTTTASDHSLTLVSPHGERRRSESSTNANSATSAVTDNTSRNIYEVLDEEKDKKSQ